MHRRHHRATTGALALVVAAALGAGGAPSAATPSEPAGAPSSATAGSDTGFWSAGSGGAIRVASLPDRAGPVRVALAALASSALPGHGAVTGSRSRVTVREVADTARGGRVVRLQQEIDGIPVLGGEVVVATTADHRVRAVNAEVVPAPPPSTVPLVDAAAARRVAADSVGAREARTSMPERWIYDSRLLGIGEGGTRLVWRVPVTAPGIDRDVLVDATDARVLLTLERRIPVLQRRICDSADGGAGYPCTLPDRAEGDAASGIADVDGTYDALGDTSAHLAALGLDSYDDRGSPLVATVRYCVARCPYENAFWDGDQAAFGTGMAADDVVAHEIAHGVTTGGPGLIYYGQSGAINESLSDVTGELVDQSNGRGDDSAPVRWLIGEDTVVGAFRDMADPPVFGDPDRMGSPLFVTGSQDSGGVHSNSGVGNKLVSLLVDGGTFGGIAVSPLGSDSTARLVHEASLLLTSGSDYAAYGQALLSACTALAGTAGVSLDDCRQVRRAAEAVEIVPAESCGTGATRTTVWGDDLADPVSTGWSSTVSTGSSAWGPATQAPDGARGLLAAGGADVGDTSVAMPAAVAVPAGRVVALVRHRLDLDSELSSDVRVGHDGGVVEYSVDGGPWTDASALMVADGYNATVSAAGGNPLAARVAFSGALDETLTTALDLTTLSGRGVRLRFRLGTDSATASPGWFVDDVRIVRCGDGPLPATSAPAPAEPDPAPAPTDPAPAPSGPSDDGSPAALRTTRVSGWPRVIPTRDGRALLRLRLAPARSRSATVQRRTCDAQHLPRCRWVTAATVTWPAGRVATARVVLRVGTPGHRRFRLAVPATRTATAWTGPVAIVR